MQARHPWGRREAASVRPRGERALPVTQGTVVGVAGGIALALAVFGTAVVEVRSGPFEHDVTAPQVDVELAGSYMATGPTAAGQDCGPAPAGQVCDPPRTEVRLEATGLPRLDGAGHYAAFLVGPGEPLALGELAPDEEGHRLDYEAAEDSRDADELVVALASGPNPQAPSVLVLGEVPLADSEGETVPLEARLPGTLGEVAGRLSVGQVGVVEVSATAVATIQGLTPADGWRYEAVLVDEDGGPPVSLGELDVSGGQASLDERVPGVVLDEHERFQVTLAPEGFEGPPGSGFPVVDVALETRSLFG